MCLLLLADAPELAFRSVDELVVLDEACLGLAYVVRGRREEEETGVAPNPLGMFGGWSD